MAATNAERQRKYRYRALKDPDGYLLSRVQVYLSPQAHRVLRELAHEWGCTQRSVIERLLIERDPATIR
jgi:DNA-binding MarR family transcriptional regulator